MFETRHEEYGNLINNMPFSLYIGLIRTAYNCSPSQNWHENLEIQFFTEGKGLVLINGEKYYVESNDIIVVNSNDIHYTYTDGILKYNCLIISTDWCKRMGIDYNSYTYEHKVKSEIICRLLKQLASCYCDKKSVMRIAKCNQILLCIMIELSENYLKAEIDIATQNKYFGTVKEAIKYIRQHYVNKLTLDEIADNIFTDKYIICRQFKKYTGQTIIEYINKYRCIQAINCLQNNSTVAEAAYTCGFDNLSFFTKTFKKYTGHIPSFYKMKS